MYCPSEEGQRTKKDLFVPLLTLESKDCSDTQRKHVPPVERSSYTNKGSKGFYPTPPASASPTKSAFHSSNPYSTSPRKSPTGNHRSEEMDQKSPELLVDIKGRRRASSLIGRFPGDMSHRPLDQLRKETKLADRAPHLKKRHIPGADAIDSLDKSAFGESYHHGGPYDATLYSRNRTAKYSPLEAVKNSNIEALKATPKENIRDALERHMPLQGTATIPPGMPASDGRLMQYEEGADLMREPDAAGGAYRRWADVKYHPEDLKGKGEPSYSVEKALKEQKNGKHRRTVSGNSSDLELQPRRPFAARQRSVSGNNAEALGVKKAWNSMPYSEYEREMRKSHSTSLKLGDELRRRIGGLRSKMAA